MVVVRSVSMSVLAAYVDCMATLMATECYEIPVNACMAIG
jgi:hypothetical protein